MKLQLSELIKQTLESLYNSQTEIDLVWTDEEFGDYSTNVALVLAKKLSKSPKEIAEAIVADITGHKPEFILDISVAGAGFINIKLTSESLIIMSKQSPAKLLEGQVVVAEYSDPNPFKILHAGHLYTSIVGDSIANLMESAGASVHRVNFGGDVGRHVAINILEIIKRLGGEEPAKLDQIDSSKRAEWLSECYAQGYKSFEADESVKQQVKDLNKRLYEVVGKADHDSALAQIYWTTRQWSYDYFDSFYERLGIKFEKYYPESEVSELGLKTVRDNVPEVYQESDGAIIFDGEKYGLHANVFINSEGLPTYAAKDVGLILKKWQDYKFNKSVIITSNDQFDYMRVVLKSVEQFRSDLSKATTHLSHGMVKLAGGAKMSSRLGNFLRATDVLDAASEANALRGDQNNDTITIGAVKYAFLKQRIGGDIIYDPAESVNLEGNSGPYLQYSHARAKNILSKVETTVSELKSGTSDELTAEERSLVRKLAHYSEIVELSITELKPHHICSYLFELAQNFNRFYENSRVVGDARQDFRLALVKLYADRLAQGLELLGIAAPDKM